MRNRRITSVILKRAMTATGVVAVVITSGVRLVMLVVIFSLVPMIVGLVNLSNVVVYDEVDMVPV